MRLQSRTGPSIPSGDNLLQSLHAQTQALQQQWQNRLAGDPASLAQLEVEIHDHFRGLADQMTASLLAHTTTVADQAQSGKKGQPLPPTAPGTPPRTGR